MVSGLRSRTTVSIALVTHNMKKMGRYGIGFQGAVHFRPTALTLIENKLKHVMFRQQNETVEGDLQPA